MLIEREGNDPKRNWLAKLPPLAARLGVKPIDTSDETRQSTVILTTVEGDAYDLFDLIEALLDRMDANASK